MREESNSIEQKLKIAFILTPITFGGAEMVCLNFLRSVDRSRFDIHPILLVRPWERESLFGREIRSLGYAYDMVPVALKTHYEPLRVWRVSREISNILKNGSFDLVHTNGYFADICSLPVARMLKLKTVATCHGFINTTQKLQFYNFLDKFVLRICHRIIAVSHEIKIEIVTSGIKEPKIVVIPNAVSIPTQMSRTGAKNNLKRQSLSISSEEIVVGFVGRLSEEKGGEFLIQAALDLKNKGARCKFLIVGDGPTRTNLEILVIKLGLIDDVIFAGFQDNVEEWFYAMDVFVLPSLSEGTPVALLEAMSHGIPVIATAVGGVPSVVANEHNGLLVKPGDVRSISDCIQRLIDDPSVREQFALQGLKTLEKKFNLPDWCRSIEGHYQQICDSM